MELSNLSQQICENIHTHREFKKINIKSMAHLLGIEISTYSNIENGKTVLTINRIEQIADALEVPALRLITYNSQQFFDIHHNETGNGVAHYHYHNDNHNDERDKKLAAKDEEILKLKKIIAGK